MFSVFETEEGDKFLVNEDKITMMGLPKRTKDGLFYRVAFTYANEAAYLKHLGTFDDINDALIEIECGE